MKAIVYKQFEKPGSKHQNYISKNILGNGYI